MSGCEGSRRVVKILNGERPHVVIFKGVGLKGHPKIKVLALILDARRAVLHLGLMSKLANLVTRKAEAVETAKTLLGSSGRGGLAAFDLTLAQIDLLLAELHAKSESHPTSRVLDDRSNPTREGGSKG